MYYVVNIKNIPGIGIWKFELVYHHTINYLKYYLLGSFAQIIKTWTFPVLLQIQVWQFFKLI